MLCGPETAMGLKINKMTIHPHEIQSKSMLLSFALNYEVFCTINHNITANITIAYHILHFKSNILTLVTVCAFHNLQTNETIGILR